MEAFPSPVSRYIDASPMHTDHFFPTCHSTHFHHGFAIMCRSVFATLPQQMHMDDILGGTRVIRVYDCVCVVLASDTRPGHTLHRQPHPGTTRQKARVGTNAWSHLCAWSDRRNDHCCADATVSGRGVTHPVRVRRDMRCTSTRNLPSNNHHRFASLHIVVVVTTSTRDAGHQGVEMRRVSPPLAQRSNEGSGVAWQAVEYGSGIRPWVPVRRQTDGVSCCLSSVFVDLGVGSRTRGAPFEFSERWNPLRHRCPPSRPEHVVHVATAVRVVFAVPWALPLVETAPSMVPSVPLMAPSIARAT